MTVRQLRRLLRTLSPAMWVLLSDLEGAFSAREDDFLRVETTGQWGPVALVISLFEPPGAIVVWTRASVCVPSSAFARVNAGLHQSFGAAWLSKRGTS